MDVPDIQERNGGSSMSDFTSGSREKVIVFGIIAALVIALVYLFFQLTGDDAEDPAADPAPEAAAAEGSGAPVGDVLALMPHSEAGLQAGAESAQGFVAAYTEVRPEETDEERLARLSPLVSEEFFGAVEALVLGAPTSAVPRGEPQALRSEAVVTGIRNIGEESVIFEVEVRFLTDTGDAGGNEPVAYAVTVVPENDGWAVYSFQGAAVGDLAETG